MESSAMTLAFISIFFLFVSVLDMQNQLRDLMQSKGVDLNDVSYGFHYPPFVSVKHLHMHGIGPISKMGLISRIIFARTNMWYCSVGLRLLSSVPFQRRFFNSVFFFQPEYIISKLKPGE